MRSFWGIVYPNGINEVTHGTWTDVKNRILGNPNTSYKRFQTYLQARCFVEQKCKGREQRMKYAEREEHPSQQKTTKPVVKKERKVPVEEAQSRPLDANHFIIHTDGACDNSYGGLAVLVSHSVRDGRIGLTLSFENTTNNRMEMLAILLGLERVRDSKVSGDVLVVSDSQYAINSFDKWRISWKRRGWQKKGGIKNLDLVQRYDRLISNYPRNVRFQWVRGHNGHEMNEMVDKMAVKARQELSGGFCPGGNEEIVGTEYKWENF